MTVKNCIHRKNGGATTTLYQTNLRYRHKTGTIRKTIPTSSRWTETEPEMRQNLIWGAGPSAIENITKGEFNTDPDTINTERLLQLFKDYYMPKRNTYHKASQIGAPLKVKQNGTTKVAVPLNAQNAQSFQNMHGRFLSKIYQS